MKTLEIRQHETRNFRKNGGKKLKNMLNIAVWYGGEFQKDFYLTVYPSQYCILEMIKDTLKNEFLDHLKDKELSK